MYILLVKTVVRGYHVYQKVQEPHIGEGYIVGQGSCNAHDRYEMAVYRRDEDTSVIVGAYSTRNIENLPLLQFTRHDCKILSEVKCRKKGEIGVKFKSFWEFPRRILAVI